MIEKMAKEVVVWLRSTSEFKLLQQAIKRLEKNRQSKQCVEQFSLDHAKAMEQPDGAGKHLKDILEKRFEKMMQVPEIAAYIKAGQQFDCVVTELHHHIDKLIDEALDERNE